eukprot:6851053-Pyramimonas_sp.AAC.1
MGVLRKKFKDLGSIRTPTRCRPTLVSARCLTYTLSVAPIGRTTRLRTGRLQGSARCLPGRAKA